MQFAINQNYDPADAVIAGVNGAVVTVFLKLAPTERREL